MSDRSARGFCFMLTLSLVGVFVLAADAVTYHRSFRNGYPSGAQGVTVRQQPNAAVLTAPKTTAPKSVTVTNRVVITKEQAVKLLKSKKSRKPGCRLD